MKKKKLFSSVVSACALAILIIPASVFAGTATAEKNTGRGGQDCGKISKRSGQNTGGMTVKKVMVGDDEYKEGTHYNIRRGTDGSTRPVIEFVNPLPANKDVKVTLDTKKGEDKTYEVNLELTDC
ncbi:MAG: hypothetical protein R2681_17730 [Pyrinomonadaceae bacterium]